MDRRTLTFVAVLTAIVCAATLPGPFNWSNRITPEILGLPFAIFWQFLCAAGISATLITWYIVDARSGDLDIDIDAIDADGNGLSAHDEGAR